MVRNYLKSRIGALVLAAAVTSAAALNAATMTFDQLPDEGYYYDHDLPGDTYVENGITATGTNGILAFFDMQGAAHIDDSGSALTSAISFTAGKLFSAATFSLFSDGYDSFFGRKKPLNILISGYFLGNLVNSASFSLSDDVGKQQVLSLLPVIGLFDTVSIELIYPENCFGAPCAHLNLDQVDLALVPLPAAGLALTGALAVMAGVSRRRRLGQRA